jgi:flavin reductase (DIM6/NTAB) family NADH-FMN oxidoreductase RutF
MKNYKEIPIDTAYRLINHGPLVLVSTKSSDGIYNIAPIAWNSPVRKKPPKLLVVVGKRHKTHENIISQKEFVVCVPHINQMDTVLDTGTKSGNDVNKFDSIDSFVGKTVDARVPVGCIGYIECRLYKNIEEEKVDIIVGDIQYVAVDEGAFDGRMLVEKECAKTLHHLGGHNFSFPIDEIKSK